MSEKRKWTDLWGREKKRGPKNKKKKIEKDLGLEKYLNN